MRDYEHYNDALVYTHIALYQVLGSTNKRKFSKAIMWMCFEI